MSNDEKDRQSMPSEFTNEEARKVLSMIDALRQRRTERVAQKVYDLRDEWPCEDVAGWRLLNRVGGQLSHLAYPKAKAKKRKGHSIDADGNCNMGCC